jgi:hypothetical protein
MAQTPSRKALRWSEKDLAQVEELLPYYSPKVVGQMLGRSEDAIKIMRQRQHIKASSKSEGWLTPNRVMRLLGMPDARPVIGWVKKGLVLGHRIAGDDTWLVHEISLRRWIVSPRSWVYFDTSRIQDLHLARLVELAQERWGDEAYHPASRRLERNHYSADWSIDLPRRDPCRSHRRQRRPPRKRDLVLLGSRAI